jgi:FkbM family methyltransferase
MVVLAATELRARFIEAVIGRTPEVVLELGCYTAEFSIACRRALPQAEVHAFEANPDVYRAKADKIEVHGVRCHNLAIGDRVGPASFLMKRSYAGAPVSAKKGSHSLRLPVADYECEPVPVQMITVDHFAREHGLLGRGCAIWMDLEGCAYEALLGAREMMATCQALMVEVEDEPQWQGQKLAPAVDALVTQFGLVADARDQEYPGQHNAMYLRP